MLSALSVPTIISLAALFEEVPFWNDVKNVFVTEAPAAMSPKSRVSVIAWSTWVPPRSTGVSNAEAAKASVLLKPKFDALAEPSVEMRFTEFWDVGPFA